MVNVKIDEDELLEMLLVRLEFWTDDADIKSYMKSIIQTLSIMDASKAQSWI